MFRKRAYGKRDRRLFSRTAAKIKEINLSPRVMRGGIRL